MLRATYEQLREAMIGRGTSRASSSTPILSACTEPRLGMISALASLRAFDLPGPVKGSG